MHQNQLWVWGLVLAAACGGKTAASDAADAALDAAVDAVADVADASDAAAAEVAADVPVPPDAAADAGCLAGGNFCPCATNTDCDSGFCVDSGAGKVCTMACTASCPSGWACEAATAGNFICQQLNLCRPCATSADCGGGLKCVTDTRPDGSSDGAFCLAACGASPGAVSCPAGYTCGTTGNTANFCVPTAGTCGCWASWATAGASTACNRTSAAGTCAGVRACAVDGAGHTVLTDCSAATPVPEMCGDKIDNNCNGLTDENGNQPCTLWYPDADGDGWGGVPECLCATPTGGFVEKSGDCNDHAGAIHPGAAAFCDGVDANCDGKPDATGSAALCDDGDPCTLDGCDPASAACVHKADVLCADGCSKTGAAGCDDANVCTTDSCAAGQCQHDWIAGCCNLTSDCTSACPTATCSTATHACSYVGPGCCMADSECVTSDLCRLGGCLGGRCAYATDGFKVDCCSPGTHADCDDGQYCTVDACATAMAGGWMQCTHVLDAGCNCGAASWCDDGNPCTADACQADLCVHSPIGGCCVTAADCNTGSGCAISACAIESFAQAGTCVVMPETATPATAPCTPAACDDGNPCTIDTCTCGGYCRNSAVAGCTLPCDATACNFAGDCISAQCDATGQCVRSNACLSVACGSVFDCDDGNPCTADLCTVSGCVWKVLSCDDGNPCTFDACAGGVCGHASVPGCAP